MSDDQLFGILRSDRLWYIGTVDHRPVFADMRETKPAMFTEEVGEQRLVGLRRNPEGYTYELIPVVE